MAQRHINYGTTPNDGTGDTLREASRKAELNFTELYNALNIPPDTDDVVLVAKGYLDGVKNTGDGIQLGDLVKGFNEDHTEYWLLAVFSSYTDPKYDILIGSSYPYISTP